MSEYLVAGLERIDKADAQSYKGQLDLPQGFDSRQYVASWVARRSVEAKKRPETIRSEGVRAEGWAVWKDNKNKACIRNLGSGPFVLMYRPKALQEAVNKTYGNQSIRRMQGEANGDTVAGAGAESGILTNKVLNEIQKLNRERSEAPIEGEIRLNDVAPTSPNIQTEIEKPRKKLVLKK